VKEAGVVVAEVAEEAMVVDVVVVDTEEVAMEEAVEAMVVAEVDVEAEDMVEDVKVDMEEVVVDMAVAATEVVEADMVGAAEVEDTVGAVVDTKHRNSYFSNSFNDRSYNPFGPSENLQHSTRNFVTQIIASLKLMT